MQVAEVAHERGEPLLVRRGLQLGPELAEPHRGDVLLHQVAPVVVPHRRQVRRVAGRGEPRLGVDAGRVVVRRVHHPVGDLELDRVRLDVGQAAAPPGARAVALLLDALDEDQPVRVGGQHGVAGAGRRRRPVAARVPASPARRAVRLVVQVRADDDGVVAVALGELHPVGDPAALGVLRRVPQRRLRSGVRAVPVEDDPQPAGSRCRDDLVHHLQRGQAAQVGVLVVVHAAHLRAGVEALVGVRQPERVEAPALDLVERRAHLDRPQPVRRAV